MKQVGISCILPALLVLAGCSIGAGASPLIHGGGGSRVGGSTNLVTRQTAQFDSGATESMILSYVLRQLSLDPLANISSDRSRDFDRTVTDTSGLSDGKRSRKLNQAHGIPLNHKRAATSRRIDTCPHPEDPYFIRSTCDHASGTLNSKSYQSTCNYRPTGSLNYHANNDVVTAGSCGPDEFCFQNDHGQQRSPVAFCVSNSNIVNLITAGASSSGARPASLDTIGPAHRLLGETLSQSRHNLRRYAFGRQDG